MRSMRGQWKSCPLPFPSEKWESIRSPERNTDEEPNSDHVQEHARCAASSIDRRLLRRFGDTSNHETLPLVSRLTIPATLKILMVCDPIASREGAANRPVEAI